MRGIKSFKDGEYMQYLNPYLPSWEYIPDGEPHVFDGRVYIFGSHDMAHGYVFCQNDYVCWSAPVENLSTWKYEGVIYKKTEDPLNKNGHMVMYAPDVTKGPDGRYYLYYVLDKANVVSVAVCNTPAGKYEFYGYVKHPCGTYLGEKEGDEPQFDPGLLTEGDNIYLYTGGDKARKGATVTVLATDMLTIIKPPAYIVPGGGSGEGTSFFGHEFFEAASMRKVDDMYYFIYSSVHMTELCYATSKHPTKDFTFGGVIVSNCDLNISTYKSAEKRTYPYGNNHGSIEKINNQWYVFYHRMSNGTWFSRQACVERIEIKPNGKIEQVEMTSQGASPKPLEGKGIYPSYIACILFNDKGQVPKITQDTRDGEQNQQNCYISDITDGTVIGFKYFSCKNVKKITLITRAYGRGVFEVRNSLDGQILGSITIVSANIWTKFSGEVNMPDGINSIYLMYKGTGNPHLSEFILE